MSEPFSWAGGVSPYNPSIVGGTGTTCKIFPSLLGPGFGNGGNPLSVSPLVAPVTVPTAATGTPAAICTIPGTGQYEQQTLSVQAGGFVYMHGTSPTLNFLFQSGTSLTYNASGQTTMATLSSAQSLTTGAYYPWSFNARLQCDSLSGIMQIWGGTFACNGVSGTISYTALTGQNLNTTNVNFVIGVTFGVSDSLAVGTLSQFSLTAA